MSEDIREGLDKILCEFHDPDIPYEEQSGPMLDWSWHFTQKILTYLHEKGVVRKVEGELPINPYSATQIPVEEVGAWLGYHKAQQDMLKAGYTLTEEIE